MSESSFEVRWGVGFEDAERRDTVRNKLRAGMELAALGLDHIGVENDSPIVVTVKTPGPDDYHAASVGHRMVNLFVRENSLSRGGPTRFFHARGLFHENLHCIRWRTAYPTRLPERAVAEGIAYSGEYQFSRYLQRYHGMAQPRRSVVESVQALPRKAKREIRASFLEDITSFDSRDPNSWDWWMSFGYKALPISKAEVVGIDAVQTRRKEGATIAEMLTWPTAKVLGLQ